jgi:hypothetical protein
VTDLKAWASRLREKEESGEKMNQTIKEMWRRALNLPENHQPNVVKEQPKNKFLDE